MFAQGWVDTADFVINLLPDNGELQDQPAISKIGFCCFICGVGVILGELISGFSLGWFLSVLGMSNASSAAIAITTILLFMTFSLLYIYHVGLRVEMKQYESYQEIRRQSSARQ